MIGSLAAWPGQRMLFNVMVLHVQGQFLCMAIGVTRQVLQTVGAAINRRWQCEAVAHRQPNRLANTGAASPFCLGMRGAIYDLRIRSGCMMKRSWRCAHPGQPCALIQMPIIEVGAIDRPGGKPFRR